MGRAIQPAVGARGHLFDVAWRGGELRLKRVELNRAETRVHNFVEFIASGRATPALGDVLAQAEQQLKELTADMASVESAKGHTFTPPPRAWIADRIAKLHELLAQRTEQSVLALRRLDRSGYAHAGEARRGSALLPGALQA